MTEPGALERARAAVAAHFGLRIEDDRRAIFAAAVERRARAATGGDEAAYLARLEAGTAAELRAIARDLTVGETYFFRNRDHLRALAEVAIPARRAEARGRALRVLSAGCSSGEEPYTLAIVLRELAPPVEVVAFDVNPDALARARAGHFTRWALRETPTEVQARYFRARGAEYVLDPAIVSAVSFEERNLLDLASLGERPFDVVFCRNVLMYFAPDAARAAVAGLTAALAPGGYLFLGHAETLRGLSTAYELCHTHDTFYYRRRTADVAQLEPPREAPLAWHEEIARASGRVAVLTTHAAPATATPTPDLSTALALLHDAVALTDSGAFGEARAACARVLEIDALNAGAHYLLALCDEQAGDAVTAREHDRAAAYLDERFAMPRLHLGLLARRAGDLSAARRELERALLLIAGEDPARVLLFGGGFSRDALVALCRAELRATGDGA